MRLGLVGHPVAHSLSPRLHQAWIREAGLDARYDLVPANPDLDGPGLIALLEERALDGANLTVPFKERVLPQLVDIGPEARLAGAVNTVIRGSSGWVGRNTDVDGFLDAVATAGEEVGHHVVILGAGGAARAVAVASARQGATVTLLNRTVSRAEQAVQALAHGLPRSTFQAGALQDFSGVANTASSIVVAVSGGGLPAIEALDLSHLAHGALWIDLNYWLDTPSLATTIRARGHVLIDGKPMLVHQGARAFQAFTGHAADPRTGFATLASGFEP